MKSLLLNKNKILLILVLFSLTTLKAQISIAPQPAFFGKIPLGSSADRNILITNLTANNITVSNVNIVGPSASKFTLNTPTSFTLFPVQSVEVNVSYSPTVQGFDLGILQMQTSSGTITDTLKAYGSLIVGNTITFERIFGSSESEDDYGNSVKQTVDGGYIIVGQTTKPEENFPDVLVVKTDKFGKPLWSKIYGGAYTENASDVIVLNDGGFLIAGTSDSYGDGTNDVFILKLDSNGDSLWLKAFSNSDIENASRIIATQDGGFILCGSTTSNSPGATSDVLVMKVDQDGNLIWKKSYGGSGGQQASDILALSDGYIFTGSTSDPSTGISDVYLVKIDLSGNLIWEKTLGGSEFDAANSVYPASDGGFILAGYTSSYGAGARDAYLLKTDANGNEQWHKTFGTEHSDGFASVIQTNDGGYLCVGYLNTFFSQQFIYDDLFVVKTDAQGNSVWQKTFGGNREDAASKVIISNNGSFIILGGSNSYSPKNKLYLIALNENGEITKVGQDKPSDQLPADYNLSQNFPNPFNPTTTIKFTIPQNSSLYSASKKEVSGVLVTLKVYNLLGKEVATLINEEKSPGNYEVKFDGSDLPSGVYFYQLIVRDISSKQNYNFISTKKMILLK
ncbi:T9SS type A sorting domain-containing protein [Melioribacteraceae bacterium 4301-Me]|uniref:T9SS type A sorting domain-containing protein n=1 Tax=Pyranulibacter aquaticus TaxID=3163344 RepID=UPI00359B2CA4